MFFRVTEDCGVAPSPALRAPPPPRGLGSLVKELADGVLPSD